MKNIALHLTAMVLLLASGCQNTTPTTEQKADNIYQFTVENNTLKAVDLNNYKGKVLLVVNTASHCGFTPQYAGLEKLYTDLKEKGFEILDFPCNQFGEQAPEADSAYAAFCQLNYKVNFAQFHKIEVNGENEHPLYHWLKAQNVADITANTDIKWNFTKFLIDREGNVVKRYESGVTIEELTPDVEKLLEKQ